MDKPFQFYIQTIGRGQKRRRTLTIEEAQAAIEMILQGQVTPMQLGAFLMLIRVREETPEEAAGFLKAIRQHMAQHHKIPNFHPDIDWGSYAGKRRQLPWFVLALMVLAQNGQTILLHGMTGNETGRLYTQTVVEQLGWPIANSLEQAAEQMQQHGLSYLDIHHFAPEVAELMALRDELGLRSPIHTLARMLNPLQASLSVHGVFHKGYDQLHQQAASYLEDAHTLAFCGDGGEAEVRPDRNTPVFGVKHQPDTMLYDFTLPKSYQSSDPTQKNLDPNHLIAVWQGTTQDAYGEAAVIQTLSMVLMAQHNSDFPTAKQQAQQLWKNRQI